MALNLSTPAADGVTRPSDLGYLAWNFDPNFMISGSIPASNGLLYVQKLYTPRAISVTNLHTMVTVVGSTLTAGRNLMGLFDAAGALVGTSGDLTSDWTTGAVHKTAALTGGPFTVAAGYFYTALFATGTTRPTFGRGFGAAVASGVGAGTSTARYVTADSGLTTALPANLGAFTASAISYWSAVS